MLPKSILDKIEEAFGRPINSSICSEVDLSFRKRLNISAGISETTIQRLFGFVKDHNRRLQPITKENIAHYCGYTSWQEMIADVGETDYNISANLDVDDINSSDLTTGTRLRLTWVKDRAAVLTYLGDNRFRLESIENSRNLIVGDILTIHSFGVGLTLYVPKVERDGRDPWSYVGARIGGLTSIEFLD